MDDIVEKTVRSIARIFDCYSHRDELTIVINAVYNAAKSKGYCEGYKQGIKDGKYGKDQRVVAHLNYEGSNDKRRVYNKPHNTGNTGSSRKKA